MQRLRQGVALVLFLASAAAAAALADHAAVALRGFNTSDVFVVRWEHGERALAGGVTTFVLTAALLFWAVRRAVRDDAEGWPSVVGAAATLLTFAVFATAWLWSYA
jgi:hypothetical protein